MQANPLRLYASEILMIDLTLLSWDVSLLRGEVGVLRDP